MKATSKKKTKVKAPPLPKNTLLTDYTNMTDQEKKWDEWLSGLVTATRTVANTLTGEQRNTVESAARELDYHRTSFTLKANLVGIKYRVLGTIAPLPDQLKNWLAGSRELKEIEELITYLGK